MQVTYSNYVEQLYVHLRNKLFDSHSNIFDKRIVVVSDAAMKRWLMLKMAQDPQLEIAFGMEILSFTEGMLKLKSLLFPSTTPTKVIPNLLELTLLIEDEIRQLLRTLGPLTVEEKVFWKPLTNYLTINEEGFLTRRSNRRLLKLAEGLAEQFLCDGQYAKTKIATWEQAKQPKEWREALWKRLFHAQSPWGYALEVFNPRKILLNSTSNSLHIHLFALSHIPPTYFHVLEALSQDVPVELYLLSVCQVFWSDIRSDKESVRLRKFLKKKGASDIQLQDLDLLLHQSNPLLANFGRVGRERAVCIESSLAQCEEDYLLSAAVSSTPAYQEHVSEGVRLTEGKCSKLTLLEALQADLLLMRKPQHPTPFERDHSLEIHVAPTSLREVQVLYERLLGLMHESSFSDEPLKPEEILVMAPNIRLYEPLIGMVFQQKESPFDVAFTEPRLSSDEPSVRALLHLMDELHHLDDDIMLPLTEWIVYLRELMEFHFEWSEDSKALRFFLDALQQFKPLCRSQPATFPFSSIKFHLKKAFEEIAEDSTSVNLRAIRFSSLALSRPIPAKVICLLGMHEEGFPRRKRHLSLLEYEEAKKEDYCPSRIDEDRYLFLEILMSARKHLVISYPQKDREEEQHASVFVQELLDYLDKMANIDGSKASLSCIRKHPYLPFHATYFSSDAAFKSYSPTMYRAAKAYYQKEKLPLKPFFIHYPIPQPTSVHSARLDINALTAYIKDPIKSYFKTRMGIYLEESKKSSLIETLQLSSLDLYHLKRWALKHTVENQLLLLEEKGVMPEGIFKKIEHKKIRELNADLQDILSHAGIHPRSIFSIEFSSHVEEALQTPEGGWLLPPLQVDNGHGGIFDLVGKIEFVHPQGLIIPADFTAKEALKAWPNYLVVQQAVLKHGLTIGSNMIFALSEKPLFAIPTVDTQERLTKLANYYCMGIDHLSPLLCDWIDLILKFEGDALTEEIKKSVHNPFHPLRNPYLQWMQSGRELPDLQSAHHHWKQCAHEVFKELLEAMNE